MIKTTQFLLLVTVLSVGGVAAQVRETPVTLGKLDGANPRGVVQGANDQGILFSVTPGARGQLVTYAEIRGEGINKLIRFEDRAEALTEARALFAAGKWEEAAEAFGQVARNYAIILNAPQNFSTEALFYQCESLLRAGNYSELAKLIEAPAAATIETKLGDFYKKSHEYQKLWAFLGKDDIEGLRSALAGYQETVLGEAKLLPAPNFIKLPTSELAQLAFLRAKVYQADGETNNALDDYYRAFTLAYGNDRLMSKQAMEGVLMILKDDPLVQADDKGAVAEIQSVAYLFAKKFGMEEVPSEVASFAVRPAVSRPVIAEDAEIPVEEAPAAESEGDSEETEGGEDDAPMSNKEKRKAKKESEN